MFVPNVLGNQIKTFIGSLRYVDGCFRGRLTRSNFTRVDFIAHIAVQLLLRISELEICVHKWTLVHLLWMPFKIHYYSIKRLYVLLFLVLINKPVQYLHEWVFVWCASQWWWICKLNTWVKLNFRPCVTSIILPTPWIP